MSGLTQTGRGSLSAMVACAAMLVALWATTGVAAADTNCGPPDSLAGSCFAAADGDQLDGPGDLIDWQSFAGLGAVVDTARGIDSKFAGGSKEH